MNVLLAEARRGLDDRIHLLKVATDQTDERRYVFPKHADFDQAFRFGQRTRIRKTRL